MTSNDLNYLVEKAVKEVLSNIVGRELKATAERLVEEATKLVVEAILTKRTAGEILDSAEKARQGEPSSSSLTSDPYVCRALLNRLISAISAPVYKIEVGLTEEIDRSLFGPRGEVYFMAHAIMDIDEKLASMTSGCWIPPVDVAKGVGERIADRLRLGWGMPKQRNTYAVIVRMEIQKWLGEDWNDETRRLVDRVVNPLFGLL